MSRLSYDPVRRFLPEPVDLIWKRTINRGKVFVESFAGKVAFVIGAGSGIGRAPAGIRARVPIWGQTLALRVPRLG
jgi:hypothetical protein